MFNNRNILYSKVQNTKKRNGRMRGEAMIEENSIIKIDGLSKRFKTSHGEVTALENIHLEIKKGEIFGIIGLSGAGKSTLVRCINFLESPTEGEIWFEGKALSTLSKKELRNVRQSMGMIFQQFNLMEQRSVIKNICFPLELAKVPKEEAIKRARELLKIVGLEERENAYPSQLSGGQKQRVAIARALATNPRVLLCDEATSALDPNTTKSILELLKQINKELGITILIITHEMDVIETICNRVAIIDKSQIAEVGFVTEIFSEPKSTIGRQLLLGDSIQYASVDNGKMFRIAFDGHSTYEPILSNLVMACKVPISVVHAEIKNINGVATGQMVIQVPDQEVEVAKMVRHLRTNHISFEEVGRDVI